MTKYLFLAMLVLSCRCWEGVEQSFHIRAHHWQGSAQFEINRFDGLEVGCLVFGVADTIEVFRDLQRARISTIEIAYEAGGQIQIVHVNIENPALVWIESDEQHIALSLAPGTRFYGLTFLRNRQECGII